ncbi:hypothetical protein [Solobacterium moorei]|uniref:Uncharacterized protein n=1 Tax=Solobacterium moorei F0204 TaxID=706433 RepID=E7MP14_9FIRM|nr:hypothetical protein [Solobacterium moorei]EFW24195.1 hypothetical protein HMPREF9430_01285 [Solobacterium moorei F0204]
MLNKEKYDLQQIDISTKTKDGKILFFELKIRGKTIHQQSYPYGVFLCEVMEYMLSWLEEEYVPDILTDKEKDYLSAVIKPFREDVECIEKVESYYGENEFIHITMKKDDDYCELPDFENGTMYKGMEANKVYTLKELGL